MELRQLAAADLQDLSDATGHTVNMAVLDGVDVLYIERCRSSSRSQRDIDLNLHVGSRLPAYCTSMGKVLLADLPPVELEERLAQMDLARRGPNTITARARLREELDRVRVEGVAVNNEELAYGLRSIAVRRSRCGRERRRRDQPGGAQLARLDGVPGPPGSGRRSPGTARHISSRLGWRPEPLTLTLSRMAVAAGHDEQLLIGGEWVEARGGERFDVTDPATGEPAGSVPDAGRRGRPRGDRRGRGRASPAGAGCRRSSAPGSCAARPT